MENFIRVRGARQHNLKSINLDIPKNKLVVFTGVSGSGKSSLAFDTIYAEGQRRYVESLSSYARQFLGIMNKPDVDSIDGLSPAISIDQKSTSHNPRSTVGTVTEIYDYLRLLFARIGHPHCPNCGREISRQSPDQIVTSILTNANDLTGVPQRRYLILSPVVRDRKGEFTSLFENLRAKGYAKVRIDRQIFDLFDVPVLLKNNKHTIEVVVDKFVLEKKLLRDKIALSNFKTRLTDSTEQALGLSDGLVIVSEVTDASFTFPDKPNELRDHLFSERFSCPICNISIAEIEPRIFSFNSPHGACLTCSGIGSLLKIDANLVFNPNLTISEGGILPYSKMFFHDTWFSRIVTTMANEKRINLRIPIGQLSADERKLLLFGTGDQLYTVRGTNRMGQLTRIHETYSGIIRDLEKRFSETESEFVRGEIAKFMRTEICQECKGARLKKEVLGITIEQKSIVEITHLAIDKTLDFITQLPQKLSAREQIIAASILKEINTRLSFLSAVGLEYLSLDRGAATLAGGEAQRIRLASQIGSGLSGVLYVLDEPSIGLHQRDNRRLITTLKKLRDLGNTVVVVEHDREIIECADWVFDFGPGAGNRGGQVIFSGPPRELLTASSTTTGKYLKNPKLLEITHQTSLPEGNITIKGARGNNLKSIDVSFPLGQFICVTGVSGSGKSTLITETLYPALVESKRYTKLKPATFTEITGVELIDKIILVDQSPIGRTPKSNPATYTGLLTQVRDLYSQLPDARARGYKPGRFSFNVKGGRCETCEGEGQIKIEMQFLSDVFVSCEVCLGKRYNSETLEVKFHGKSIAEVLDMTVDEAVEFFRNLPGTHEKLQTLKDVGLGYIHLGQSAPTLSGGESQRVKLATELSKRQTGKTVYILDEPTTGLHFADIKKFLEVVVRLVAKGNTVIVIEHNLDVVKNADYLIDLGPEGGDKGGYVVTSGTPDEVAKHPASYTGQFLQEILK
ncbi:MAG: UvrABC system protein A [Candidatus Gottesmanbacteria bacterium GW2011_GWA1_43_11]|uniref:UvrABC system protein A n=1 Tax=Candidatus Gottesmanbacteria bacterium GW2011_GWA1_43_11 TaxID=1618436 RepID=A0A0G1CFX1_9BACT|nr:MAG: UvrABC system protein A [Candidatus Gottesmanbacteria bacterium GW2011_GWA1_43_11]